METIRKYIEKHHYSRKQGGGSFYRWFDIDISANVIVINHLHSVEEGKKLPKNGSGSSLSISLHEAKILVAALSEAVVISEQVKTSLQNE